MTGPRPGTRTGSRLADRLVLTVLAALLVATPWPLGSRLPWAGLAAAGLVYAVFGAWALLRTDAIDILRRSPVLLPIVAFLGWVAFQLALGLTTYPFGSLTEALRYGSFGLVLVLAATASRTVRARGMLLVVLLVMATAVAGFGIVQHLTWNGKLFWFYEPPFGGTSPFGAFNNRNYHAGYMVAALGPALGLLFATGTSRWRVPAGLVLCLGAASVVLSLSRGGLVAMTAAGVMAAGFAAARAASEGTRRVLRRVALSALALLLVAALVAGAVYALGQGGRVTDRLETFLRVTAERSVEGRVTIWRDTLVMIAERPLTGFGLDAFVWGHLAYRSTSNGFPQHAHNEYLETVAETGIVGGFICLWFLAALGRSLWGGYRRAAPGLDAGLCLGAIVSWAGILVLALTDFPTIIPATNYVLATVAGLGLATTEPL